MESSLANANAQRGKALGMRVANLLILSAISLGWNKNN
jgi:hypothetical protein